MSVYTYLEDRHILHQLEREDRSLQVTPEKTRRIQTRKLKPLPTQESLKYTYFEAIEKRVVTQRFAEFRN